MSNVLDSAVAAARSLADAGADDGAATRLRIRESLAARGASRKKLWTLLAATIGTMFASTAFALQAGWEPPWSSRAAAVVPSPPEPAITSPVVATMPRTSVMREEAPAMPVVTVRIEQPEPSRPRTIAIPQHAEEAPPPAVPAAPEPPPAPAPDAELAAYRTAHTAHFKGNDPTAALSAWDAYLAQFPTGRLAPEARYDRALVLVKLKRYAEARTALAPFAAAATGSYRQGDAARILDAIRDR